MTPREEKRREYEWAFALHLHTPPHLLDLLTVEQFDNGCAAIDRLVADSQAAAAKAEQT